MSGDDTVNYFIEFYLSLIAYYVLHMIFVIAGDFIEAFSIPPLNIGIYIDKLAAIRALLMVIADALEYGVLDQALQDGGRGNYAILNGGTAGQPAEVQGTKTALQAVGGVLGVLGVLGLVGAVAGLVGLKSRGLRAVTVGISVVGISIVAAGIALVTLGSVGGQVEQKDKIGSPRRLGSIVSFVFMLVCRIVYLWLVYYSDNKSLSVFITLCLEGFWFGVFQNSFFAIGPKYNAVTSLGIHTMGNFIFFIELILNKLSPSRPWINSLSKVRVHAWTVVVTSVIALGAWLWFCLTQSCTDDATPDARPKKDVDVWSPLLLFPVGAFAKDLAYPGILPFAFLDPERANLVNYVTPSFFMTGASVIVLLNDIPKVKDKVGFKNWSAATGSEYKKRWNNASNSWQDESDAAANAAKGVWWNWLWLLNVPKYVAFFITMFGIHGIFPGLRCIVQCRWRVMLLTMFVVVPRAILEVAGYVGVANYAIGRSARGTKKIGADGRQEGDNGERENEERLAGVPDYNAFQYIAYHDMLAMFCRFAYGKLAVGYK